MDLWKGFEIWLGAAPRAPRTARRYAAAVKRLGPTITLASLTKEWALETQRLLLHRGLTPVFVRAELASVRAVLAELEAQDLFPLERLAQIRKVALPPERRRLRRVRFCDRSELDVLVAAAVRLEPRLELPILVCALAGPRIGELARLRADDRHGRSLSIDTRPELGELGTCKTGPRAIPICAELAQIFDTRLPRSGWLFPATRPRRAKTPFLAPWSLERDMRRVRQAAGLAPDLSFRVLRATRASMWAQGGVSIYKIADWMGHSVLTCQLAYGSLTDLYDPDCERTPAA